MDTCFSLILLFSTFIAAVLYGEHAEPCDCPPSIPTAEVTARVPSRGMATLLVSEAVRCRIRVYMCMGVLHLPFSLLIFTCHCIPSCVNGLFLVLMPRPVLSHFSAPMSVVLSAAQSRRRGRGVEGQDEVPQSMCHSLAATDEGFPI
uniref:T. congolense-specific, cell surface-expressed gene family n=1 Tax=Trypanosoma congolense (strain IL3000) TaxID=1068625 RepID=F9WC20_TRYCI|nr:hypothetical protein, unlikely [Trypanosoma congolense IL3000]